VPVPSSGRPARRRPGISKKFPSCPAASRCGMLTTALLFWASILPRRADTRTRIVGVFSLFTTSMHSTLLARS
jgi:hypothetical protein